MKVFLYSKSECACQRIAQYVVSQVAYNKRYHTAALLHAPVLEGFHALHSIILGAVLITLIKLVQSAVWSKKSVQNIETVRFDVALSTTSTGHFRATIVVSIILQTCQVRFSFVTCHF